VTDPVISRFAQVCGASGPLDLRVGLVDGGVLAEGSVPMPFTLVGRDDACDVTLTDAEVNPRHAWLQVIGGRVFAVDLGSRTGLGWDGGDTGSGWLDVGTPVQVGPFQIRLKSPVSPKPAHFPPRYSPLQTDPACTRSRGAVTLEFRNGKRAKDRWVVNRLITLVGRAPECKVRLTAEDITGHHCGLVFTGEGLWVVDLSGRGVVVNGERMRVSPLPHGAELWVGRFLIGVQYPGATNTPPIVRGTLTPPTPIGGLSTDSTDGTPEHSPAVLRAQEPPPEDEVPLGFVSPSDTSGLPSSHIMADAFRLWTLPTPVSGPVSNPIMVAGSGSTPPTIPVPAAHPTQPALDLLATPASSAGAQSHAPASPAGDKPAEAVSTLLRQLGEVHAQLFAQFQNSLVLLVQLFGCLRRDQLPAMQRELARIQELNAELAQLQGEVARRAAESATPAPGPKAGGWITTATPTPLPDYPVVRHATNSSALHDWVMDRVNTLQLERQARWQTLLGMFTGKPA
jgi:pSer/pThr/pTyr-binding forkhead associated (FHA) protein